MGTDYIVFFQIISFCVSIEFALGKGVWLIPIYVLGDWIKINKLKQKPLLFLLLPLKFYVDSQKINLKKNKRREKKSWWCDDRELLGAADSAIRLALPVYNSSTRKSNRRTWATIMLAGLFFHLSLVCLSAEFHNNKTLLTIRFPFEQKEKKKEPV